MQAQPCAGGLRRRRRGRFGSGNRAPLGTMRNDPRNDPDICMSLPDFHLDLGCGDRPRNPYGRARLAGVDIRPLPAGSHFEYRVANLALQPIPFPDDSFGSVSAFDFIEHMPRVLMAPDGAGTVFPFVRLMDEIWRVLAPGGAFTRSRRRIRARRRSSIRPTSTSSPSAATLTFAGMRRKRGCAGLEAVSTCAGSNGCTSSMRSARSQARRKIGPHRHCRSGLRTAHARCRAGCAGARIAIARRRYSGSSRRTRTAHVE